MKRMFYILFLLALLGLSPTPADAQTADFSDRLRRAEEEFRLVRDYNASAKEFNDLLKEADPLTRPGIVGYLNASLYTLGRHEEALQLICRESQRLPSSPDHWIFDIHAHARKIALNEGYARSIKLMQALRTSCALASFAPFWAAIPLAKMEYLRAGVHVLSEGYVLPEKDRTILRQLLERHPKDPYAEYAKHFLHDFKLLRRPELLALKRDPDPVITPPRPLFAEDPYVRAQINKAPPEDRQELETITHQQACRSPAQCAIVVKWLPNSIYPTKLLDSAVYEITRGRLYGKAEINFAELEDLGRIYFAHVTGKTTPASEFSTEFRYFLDRINTASETEKRSYYTIYTSRECSSFPENPQEIDPSSLANQISTCLAFLSHFRDSARVPEIASKEIQTLVTAATLVQLSDAYNHVRALRVPISGRAQPANLLEQHLDRIMELKAADRDSQLLNYAIKIRGRVFKNPSRKATEPRFPALAARVFEYLADKQTGTPIGEKALWLWQSSQHNVGIGNREAVLEQFIVMYPRSELIDDAYAELGLMHIHQEKGRELLEKVYKDFPTKNAADNALYHLANRAIDEGRYLTAANYFRKMFVVTAGNRLRSVATKQLPVLTGANEGLRTRKYVKGLALSQRGSVTLLDGSLAKGDDPLKVGDDLIKIDGKPIEFELGFYDALAKKAPGDWVTIVFERGIDWDAEKRETRKKEMAVRLQVVQATVFDVKFVDYNDKLVLRDKPDANAAQLGTIPPSAECLRYAGSEFSRGKGTSLWVKINYTDPNGLETSGWVNSTFLRPSTKCLN